jgi:hypothetical protein
MKKNSEGIVINNDMDEFQRYKVERLRVVQQKSLEQKVENLEHQLTAVLNEISKLKNRIN